MDDTLVHQPTLLAAAKNHRWLVAAFAVIAAFLAFLVGRLVLNDWEATSSVLVEDPAASQLFDQGTFTNPERYVASQVAIIESPELAAAVQAVVGEREPLTVQEIIRRLTVSTSRDSGLIGITFRDPDPERAMEYASAYLRAYENYRDSTTARTFEAAIAGLDESIAAVDEELIALLEEIQSLSEVTGSDEFRQRVVGATEAFLATDPSAEEIDTFLAQLQSLQIIATLESESPQLTLLFDSRREIMNRRTQLVIRRDQLQVDFALASTGIIAVSEPIDAEAALGTAQLSILGLILGLMAGIAASYFLTLRNQTLTDRRAAESVVGSVLLGEVPRFEEDSYGQLLPTLNDPSSPEAESYRFVGKAIVARLNQSELVDGISRNATAITSALTGEGKTITAANTAVALATRGKSVLLVDADFANPALTQLLLEDPGVERRGLTDVVEGDANLRDVTIPLNLGPGTHVDFLTRGTVQISAADLFDSPVTKTLFELMKLHYAYVLIDAPPLLQVSYSSAVVQCADSVVTVVPHGSRASVQRELMDRLKLIDAHVLGYVYNKAPRRAEMMDRRASARAF